MRTLLNLIWAVCGGFLTALEYLAAGVVCCLTVVGIPFGVQCFKLAGLSLFPFGKEVRQPPSSPVGFVFNVVWFLFAGVWIFLTHLGLAAASAVTIIGLPFAFQHLKLGLVALTPFGARIQVAR